MSELYQIPALILTALCHIIVIGQMTEHKHPRGKFIVYSSLYAACFVGAGTFGYAVGGSITLISYVGIVICLFIFSCMVSRGCFFKKCFLFITYFCLFSVLDNILKLTVKFFLPQASDPAGYYVAIVLRCAVLLLILAIYKRYAVAVFRPLADSNASWWNLALIALLFYVLQAVISVLNVKNVMRNEHLFLVLAALSFLMCAVYGVVFSNISYMKKEAEAALVRQNAENLFARLSTLQDAEETHRRLRHDMRHHVGIIAEYAKSGDLSAVLAYTGEYRTEISEMAPKQYSVNKTINSILSVYEGKTEKNSISFLARCNAPDKLAVREIDIIALLGNLLENALHGCLKSEKEKLCIEIHIHVRNNRLIIVCDNTCPDDLKLSGGLPTGKSIGVSSILAVCRKYSGNLDYKIEKGICSVCAVLSI